MSIGSTTAVTVTGGLLVTTGSGTDTVSLDKSTLGSLAVSTGAGADTITVLTLTVGNAVIDAGAAAREMPIPFTWATPPTLSRSRAA